MISLTHAAAVVVLESALCRSEGEEAASDLSLAALTAVGGRLCRCKLIDEVADSQ